MNCGILLMSGLMLITYLSADAQNKLNNDLSVSDLRKVWDSTGKPLLRVGKNGVQVTNHHMQQSLRDMCADQIHHS